MTIKTFKPKGVEEIKAEIITNYGIDYDSNKELVDKMVEDRLKDESFKASLHEDKKKHLKGKEFYKEKMVKAGFDPKTGELIKKVEPKGSETPLIAVEDKAYLFGRGYFRTEVQYLEKIMKTTGKGWEEALKDNLFIAWKSENDKLIKRRGSVLGASRGGISGKEKTDHDKIVEEFSQLPRGFAQKK